MIQKFYLSLCLILFGNAIHSQNILDRFIAQQNGNQVVVTWVIKSGYTCNGIGILTSTDSLNFIEVGSIEGICGALDEPVSYNFVHTSPVGNKTNYYRLELGGVGSTEIVSVEYLDFGSASYLVRPNPIYTEAKISFENDNSSLHELKLYNVQGKQVYSSKTNSNFFLVKKAQLNSGMYVFTISLDNSNQQRILSGKLLISN